MTTTGTTANLLLLLIGALVIGVGVSIAFRVLMNRRHPRKPP
ncbi:MAG: LPXTG cell wall anchor domain-containing protein [Candidatus Dormibacteria bacterium]